MKQLFFVNFLAILVLSTVNVFVIPSIPLLRSSLGILVLLTLTALLWIFFHAYNFFPKEFSKIDFLVLTFLLWNLVSLAVSPGEFQPSVVRMLLVAIVSYFFARMYPFSQSQLCVITSSMGAGCVLISLMSLLYILFPTSVTQLANTYFFGTEPMSIVYDFKRGRVAPWGNIMSTFPFFLGLSSLIYQQRIRGSPYVFLLGLAIISFAIITSGSRIRIIVFLIGILWYFWYFTFFEKTFFRRIAILTFIGTLLFSLPIASARFGYNVVDRFLLSNRERDVEEPLNRFMAFERALLLFRSNPLFGVGIGNSLDADEGTFRKDLNFPHSIYLSTLAESGIPGLVLYLMSVSVIVNRFELFASIKHQEVYPFLAVIFLYFLNGFFEVYQPNSIILIFSLFGLIEQRYQREITR